MKSQEIMLKIPSRRSNWILSIYLILPAALWPLRSTQPLKEMSNEYQNYFSWGGGVNRGWRLSPTTSPPSVSRLFTKCEILDVS
jgi:hypothetical protein